MLGFLQVVECRFVRKLFGAVRHQEPVPPDLHDSACRRHVLIPENKPDGFVPMVAGCFVVLGDCPEPFVPVRVPAVVVLEYRVVLTLVHAVRHPAPMPLAMHDRVY